MTIMEVEWKSAPEVVVMRPGAEDPCPLGLLEEVMRQFHSVATIDVGFARRVLNAIDQYFYVRGRVWPLKALIRAYATEVSSHESWGRRHTIYRAPDDFADVLKRVMRQYNRASDVVAMRRKLRDAMKLPWEELKDRLLAMEAAEDL